MEEQDFFNATRLRLGWKRWSGPATIVAFVTLGVASELIGGDVSLWLPPFVFAGVIAIYEYVWVPRRIRNWARPLIG